MANYPVIPQITNFPDAKRALDNIRQYFNLLRSEKPETISQEMKPITTTALSGILMQTPDGTKKYTVSIDNSGNVITTLLT